MPWSLPPPKGDGVGHVADSSIGENRLLNALSPNDFAGLKGDLKKTSLVLGSVLHAPGDPIKYVYFPLSGMVSLLTVMKSGEAIETGIIGREGVVGTAIATNGAFDKSSDRANCRHCLAGGWG